MSDGEIVKTNLIFKKNLDLENFWSKTESWTESKTMLDLKIFTKNILLQKMLKYHV